MSVFGGICIQVSPPIQEQQRSHNKNKDSEHDPENDSVYWLSGLESGGIYKITFTTKLSETHVESIPANVFSRELIWPTDTGFVVMPKQRENIQQVVPGFLLPATSRTREDTYA